MSARQLGQRAAADLCFDGHRGIYYGDIVDRRLTNEQAREVARAVSRVQQVPLQIIDAPRMTIGRLGTTVRRWKRRFAAKGMRLRLVVIDYLQLLQPDTREKDLYTRITEVSKGVKAVAKANDVAVIALAQLSRGVEQRGGDHRPNLGDLRDSGQIEQDADGVCFLYRAEYYLKKDERADEAHPKHEAWKAAMEAVKGQIEYIVAKRRERPECTTKGRFYGSFQAVR
jgi:replicative DNA helicase